MTRTVSLGTQVKQVMGLLDTKDLGQWENQFVRSIAERTSDGTRTELLSERQIECLGRIWQKHFA